MWYNLNVLSVQQVFDKRMNAINVVKRKQKVANERTWQPRQNLKIKPNLLMQIEIDRNNKMWI